MSQRQIDHFAHVVDKDLDRAGLACADYITELSLIRRLRSLSVPLDEATRTRMLRRVDTGLDHPIGGSTARVRSSVTHAAAPHSPERAETRCDVAIGYLLSLFHLGREWATTRGASCSDRHCLAYLQRSKGRHQRPARP